MDLVFLSEVIVRDLFVGVSEGSVFGRKDFFNLYQKHVLLIQVVYVLGMLGNQLAMLGNQLVLLGDGLLGRSQFALQVLDPLLQKAAVFEGLVQLLFQLLNLGVRKGKLP